MKKLINKFSLFTLALLTSFAFSMSSCSEDLVNPDHSAMPPKNLIKTPPRKN
ncbi:hypothetical protein OKW21_005403 [Catalinimonas alkaloidigena]|uniref:hypothetical protein n=1 Tax=Catalinimonas alkaloidigena TaxID=1075417 RepID=UPI00240630A2|nr:hypothetical protein [Catalinimonas alkaloidigena]MDF9800140.1 hypothetical protein [Catalinimonas alkaloidigena]